MESMNHRATELQTRQSWSFPLKDRTELLEHCWLKVLAQDCVDTLGCPIITHEFIKLLYDCLCLLVWNAVDFCPLPNCPPLKITCYCEASLAGPHDVYSHTFPWISRLHADWWCLHCSLECFASSTLVVLVAPVLHVILLPWPIEQLVHFGQGFGNSKVYH